MPDISCSLIVLIGMAAVYLWIRFAPKIDTTVMNHLLSVDEMIPGKLEVGICDGEGTFDRLPMHGKEIICIYVRRLILDKGLMEIIEVIALREKGWIRGEFLDGELKRWTIKRSPWSPEIKFSEVVVEGTPRLVSVRALAIAQRLFEEKILEAQLV
jgi:hypothetical protein